MTHSGAKLTLSTGSRRHVFVTAWPVEQDVKDGRAAFYLGNADEIGAIHVDIGLPQCAIVHADQAEIPAVVIQSERADDKHYIGYRPIAGGNGLCMLSEVELLSEPDARFG